MGIPKRLQIHPLLFDLSIMRLESSNLEHYASKLRLLFKEGYR